MSANKVGSVPNLTFVSMTGPTLDDTSAKAMRAHTTRANFARRRRRLVREYADQKKRAACVQPLQVEEDCQTTDWNQVVDTQFPIFSHPGLGQKLNEHDAFLIDHCTRDMCLCRFYRCLQLIDDPCIVMQAMGHLHLAPNSPASDATLSVMQSDWARFLFDPTMLDVSLCFARHVYAARLQHHAIQLVVGGCKGRALRSVIERLKEGSKGLNDSFVAAVLMLTVLDVRLAI